MTVSAELGDLLRDGDRVLVATGAGEPACLVEGLLAGASARGIRLEIVQVLTGSRGRVLDAVRDGHRVVSPVPGRGDGAAAEVLPSSMMQLARAIESGALGIDALLFSGVRAGASAVTPGLCVDLVPVAFERARLRAVELNAGLPDVPADPLPLDRCELVVECDHPPPVLTATAADATAQAIAGHVAELVDDGDVLEIGVGRTLAGVADALVEAGVGIAVHTGMVSDWARRLVDAGVAERPLGCGGGASVLGAVAMGSPELYLWLDGNDAVRLAGSLHAHDPAHLAELGGFTAVNAVSRVDCFGQVGVAAEVASVRAVGGLLDFATAGAYGGRSVVVLDSVDRAGRSRIVPSVPATQLPSPLVTHVVTEHGVADLAHRTWAERARELIAVAHPDHRAELRRALGRL